MRAWCQHVLKAAMTWADCGSSRQVTPYLCVGNYVVFMPGAIFLLPHILPSEMSCLQEVSEPNRASIYRSLTINISKEMMCYSDFPIPADYPNYMHHSKILTYFRMYAEHFKLLRHVHFQVTKSTWIWQVAAVHLTTYEKKKKLLCILDLSEERETDIRLFTHR